MIAYVLTRSDSAPSYCVGAHVPVLGQTRRSWREIFVAETCESDGLCSGSVRTIRCVSTSSPSIWIITGRWTAAETFESFFSSTHKTVFLCADCTNCRQLAPKCRTAITFGLSAKADYRAIDIEQTACGSRFTVSCRDQRIGVIELSIPVSRT